MAQPEKKFNLQTLTGETVTQGGMRVTPESQAFTANLPFGRFVYQRPLAVVVERDGQTQRIPIVDVTRIALIAIGGISIVYLSIVSRRFAR